MCLLLHEELSAHHDVRPGAGCSGHHAEYAGYRAALDYLHLGELVERTNDALRLGAVHPLLVVSAAALDLLCIHPFADGNGRVTRLVTNHLLTRAGYGVVRYASLEQLIYDTKDDYYRALAASTECWFDDGHHQLWPWETYLLARLAQAYDRFETRVSAGVSDRSRESAQVRHPAA